MAPTFDVIIGDVRDVLQFVEPSTVRTVVTSPPYWGLRDYGVGGQIGLESTPDEYVTTLVSVFRHVRRALRDDGTLWLNLGDSYAGSGRGGNPEAGTKQGTNRGSQSVGVLYGREQEDAERQRQRIRDQFATLKASGIKQKDLVGIPWLVAFALRADGWYLRSDIIWAKPNPMPESVLDRPTRAHEYIFLLSKSPRYYYNSKAIREPFADSRMGKDGGSKQRQRNRGGRNDGYTTPNSIDPSSNGGKNKRSVWTISPQPIKGSIHFAIFPEALVEPCILAGSEESDLILDPFCGSGRTGIVALKNNRNFLGIELNPDYAALAESQLTMSVSPPPPERLPAPSTLRS